MGTDILDTRTGHASVDKPVVYIDVDDTLIRSAGTKRIPMPRVVDKIRKLHREGATLYLWSSGGAEYAKSSAEELGISDCFVGFLPKPTVIIDDQQVSDWRYCKHELPMSY
jgi:cation transport ATPase